MDHQITSKSAITVLLALTCTLASAASPDDLSKIPTTFCKTSLIVSEETHTCEDNDTFVRASQGCIDKLNKLELTLGKEAEAIALAGEGNQRSELGTGVTEYEFSEAALVHLKKIAKISLGQMKDYSLYVFLPPDIPEVHTKANGDHYAFADRAACFREPQKKIREAQLYLKEKIAMYESRLAESKLNRKKLAGDVSDFGSLAGSPKLSSKPSPRKPSAKLPGKHFDSSRSDISGLPQSKAKQKKLP